MQKDNRSVIRLDHIRSEMNDRLGSSLYFTIRRSVFLLYSAQFIVGNAIFFSKTIDHTVVLKNCATILAIILRPASFPFKQCCLWLLFSFNIDFGGGGLLIAVLKKPDVTFGQDCITGLP